MDGDNRQQERDEQIRLLDEEAQAKLREIHSEFLDQLKKFHELPEAEHE